MVTLIRVKKVRVWSAVTSPAKWRQAQGKAGTPTHREGLPGSPLCRPRVPATEVPARLRAISGSRTKSTEGSTLACAHSLGLLPCT